ncbi:Phage capsid family protein [Rubinisphaera italica]|uniref:Phage capsid family protein n=2 Tax=Rubinisphaera italica TaxID=2527969 RepID=A0A5C5XQ98_9PLAN|nr:Phage capsid family protein [Rubinisphaera italica]
MSWIKIKELRESANNDIVEAGKVLTTREAAGEELTAEDNQLLERNYKSAEEKIEKIKVLERQAEAEKSIEQRIGREDKVSTPVDKDIESRAFDKWLRYGKSALNEVEVRALSKGTSTEGAEFVPESFADFYVSKMSELSSMEEAGCRIITTENGRDIPVPVLDDSSNTGELLNEGSTANEEADPATGEVILKAYVFDSKVVPVSIHLVEDAAFPIQEWLGEALAHRVADIENSYFTTGTGTNQPGGVKTKCTDSGILASSASGTKYADLVSLKYGVKKRYRGKNSIYMMNSTMLSGIKKLTDTTGRPLWQPGFGENPPEIDGHRYVVNDDLADVDILFGDFSHYVIRRVRGPEMKRFDDSAYMKKLQYGYIIFERADGNLTNTEAIHKYAHSTYSGQPA